MLTLLIRTRNKRKGRRRGRWRRARRRERRERGRRRHGIHLGKIRGRGTLDRRIQLLSAIIVGSLDIWPRNVQMRLNIIIAYCVEKIHMSLLIVMKKCVLNVIKLDIKQEIVRKKILLIAKNVTMLVIGKIGALKNGSNQLHLDSNIYFVFNVANPAI